MLPLLLVIVEGERDMEIHELSATLPSPRIQSRHEFDAEREIEVLLGRGKEMLRRVRERQGNDGEQ